MYVYDVADDNDECIWSVSTNTRARVAIEVVPIALLRVTYVTDDGLSLRALRHVPVLLNAIHGLLY